MIRTYSQTRFSGMEDYKKQLESGELAGLPQCELCSGECFSDENAKDSVWVCAFYCQGIDGDNCSLKTI